MGGIVSGPGFGLRPFLTVCVLGAMTPPRSFSVSLSVKGGGSGIKPAYLSLRPGGSADEIRDVREIRNPSNSLLMEAVLKEEAQERSRFVF